MARTEHQKELLAAYRERPITGAVCAVTDTVSGRTLLLASPNPAGQRNRFQFAVSTDMPLHLLRDIWRERLAAEGKEFYR